MNDEQTNGGKAKFDGKQNKERKCGSKNYRRINMGDRILGTQARSVSRPMGGMQNMMKHKVEQENASIKNNDDARIVNGSLFALRTEVKYSVPEPKYKNFQRCHI